MHRAASHRAPAQRTGAVVHHLELIHDMEMRPQHAMGRALGKEGHGRVDGLVLRPPDEVGAPAEMPVRQIALDAGVFHFLVGLYQWHCRVSCLGWVPRLRRPSSVPELSIPDAFKKAW